MYTAWKIIENTAGLTIHMHSLQNTLSHNAHM